MKNFVLKFLENILLIFFTRLRTKKVRIKKKKLSIRDLKNNKCALDLFY